MEKWFTLLVKTKLRFLGVEDAYFHTVCFNSSALRASVVVKLVLQRYAFCVHYKVRGAFTACGPLSSHGPEFSNST